MTDRDHTAPGETTNDVAPERLAALLDGKLNEQEREKLLSQLIQSPNDVALLASVAAALREMDGERVARPTTPPRVRELAPPAWYRRAHARAWLVATAATVVVASGVWVVARRTNAPTLGAAQYVAMLDNSADRLPGDWDGRPWIANRGSQDAAVAARARAVRIGARLVDLQIAVSTSDSAAAVIAMHIARLLTDVPSSGAISNRFVSIANRAGEPTASLQKDLDEAASAVRIAAGEEAVDIGSWLEAARVAAVRRDAAYFRRGASRSMLDGIARGADSTPEMRTMVDRIRSTVDASIPSWEQLTTDLEELLAIAAHGV